jgi:site-specific recombinase XerD
VHRFDEFIRSRQYLKNVTARTVDWYRDSFRSFARFHCGDEYSKQSLAAFVVAVRDSGVSPISCNTYCRAINTYLRWLHEEGYEKDLLRIAPMKTEKKVLATFSRSHVDAFLRWKPQTSSILGFALRRRLNSGGTNSIWTTSWSRFVAKDRNNAWCRFRLNSARSFSDGLPDTATS